MEKFSIKHVLILNLSKELNIPESVIDAVITHEIESGKGAMMECNSIEFSGFGKFYFNVPRAKWKLGRLVDSKGHLERLIEEAESPKKRAGYQLKLQTVISEITLLKTKLKE